MSFFSSKPIGLGACVVVLHALSMLSTAKACSCFESTFCETTSATDVLVSGSILSRTQSGSEYVYKISVDKVYKQDTSLEINDVVKFTSPDSSAACGVYLDVDTDYLVGLYYDHDDGNSLEANLCGPTKSVSSLTEEEWGILEMGGMCYSTDNDDDPCEGKCTEYQECIVYSDSSDGAKCGDTCADGTCASGQVCELVEVLCFVAPCYDPPEAQCIDDSDVDSGLTGSFSMGFIEDEFMESWHYMSGSSMSSMASMSFDFMNDEFMEFWF